MYFKLSKTQFIEFIVLKRYKSFFFKHSDNRVWTSHRIKENKSLHKGCLSRKLYIKLYQFNYHFVYINIIKIKIYINNNIKILIIFFLIN